MTGSLERDISRGVRTIKDYPRKGVAFKDLTTLWKDGPLARRVTNAFVSYWKGRGLDKVVGIEARGFIVGAPVAYRLGIGFVPARKVGKLPGRKMSVSYELEYGRQGLEIHSDAVSKGDRILIVDDLLATGGTAKAAGTLVEKLGAKVAGFAFVTELEYLKGREKLAGYEIQSLAKFPTNKS
jgi:adenine phosphoribosyltransferase